MVVGGLVGCKLPYLLQQQELIGWRLYLVNGFHSVGWALGMCVICMVRESDRQSVHVVCNLHRGIAVRTIHPPLPTAPS